MEQPALSIILIYNDTQQDVEYFFAHLETFLSAKHIKYEILILDKTGISLKKFSSLSDIYPISNYAGNSGKNDLIIQTLTSNAKYKNICILDTASIQSFFIISKMLEKTEDGDIVLLDVKNKTGSEQLAQKLFLNFLHNLPYPLTSPIKLIKKEVIERINIDITDPNSEFIFLLKARDAGYKIVTLESETFYQSEKNGRKLKKLQFVATSVKLKILRPETIPFHPEMVKKVGNGFHYKGQEFIHHSNLDQSQTAFHRLSGVQIVVLGTYIPLILEGLIVGWHTTIVIFVAVITVIYFIDLLFNLFLIYRSFSKPKEIKITPDEIALADEKPWPQYTVFCPLYREWQVLPQFISSISHLEYPKDKLQVLLILEDDDKETIEKVKNYTLPSYFETHIVPHSHPKTKPKACNYGLQFAKGEYVVIYDAEDIPDPLQLKKIVLAFQKTAKQVVCIQAKLNFYNPHQNLLTKVFTAEYSLWFDLVLTGLHSIEAPIPLGGTSNHFKLKDLQALKGWDSFNVTEDCDLGMRLVKRGFKTAVVDSITLEEANSKPKNWFWQRTRWIKGYMQTYLLHMRNPQEFIKDWKEPHVITFQLVVGGKVLSMFINPFMWITTILYFSYRAHVGLFIESFLTKTVLYMGVLSLLVGNFLYMYYYMIGCAKHGHDDLVKYVFLVPFYWLAISMAAYVALFKLFTQPHYWSKTKHGLHLRNEKTIKQASKVLGHELIDDNMKGEYGKPAPAFVKV